jgi:hypothetical protein
VEFPHIERRKTGLRRNAPVFFRVRAKSRALVPLAAREIIAQAAATHARAPDLALLDRPLLQEKGTDAAVAAFARSTLASLLLRATHAFDWRQPTWPERLRIVLMRLAALLEALRDRHTRTPSTAG